MVTHATLTLLYDYHYWITRRMLEACEVLTPEQWTRSQGHSWDSVHGLVTHMLTAEIIWLSRWQGVSPTRLRRKEELPTLADVRREWAVVESDLRAFLAGCEEVRLNQPLTYTNTRGQSFTVGLGQLMLHLANHGTHHRGEWVAMLTLLGVPHPEDDLLWYLLEIQKSTVS